MKRLAALHAAIAVCILATGLPAGAQELFPSGRSDVTVFGGVMTEGDFPGNSLIPFGSGLDEVYLLGLAYDREFATFESGFRLGGEVGVAGRFGDGESAELWLGPSVRYEGIEVGPVSLSVGFVVGLSAVTDTVGIERQREEAGDGDATLLYYAGPEIGLTLDAFPRTEIVYRTHHRSGAENISYLPSIGEMGDTVNSNLIGLRHHF